MTDIRELRLAIKAKLEHRRRLIAENARLHNTIEVQKRLMKSELFNVALEHLADEIMAAVIDEAIKASAVVADQTADNGDYVIGIDIPSLHIRRRLVRYDVDGFNGGVRMPDMPSRHVHYRSDRGSQ